MNWIIRLSSLLPALVVFAVSGAISSGVAQDNTDQKQRIDQLATRAKSVSSAAEMTEIIQQCASLLTEPLTDPKHRRYVETLKAWAHNRRGESRMELAQQLSRVKNVEQADEATSKAFADFERSIELDPKRWKAILNRGALKCTLGGYEAAVKDFSKVIELKPDCVNGWFNRAETRYALKEFEKALKDYEKTIELSPDDAQAMTGRAHTLLNLGRTAQALSDYEAVANMKPDSARALANRGDVLQLVGEFGRARQDYEAAITIQPLGVFQQKLAWLLATCPDKEHRQPLNALRLIQQAIKTDGPSADYLDTLAAALAASGDFEAAQTAQRQAIDLAGDNPQFQQRQAMYRKNQAFQQQVLR